MGGNSVIRLYKTNKIWQNNRCACFFLSSPFTENKSCTQKTNIEQLFQKGDIYTKTNDCEITDH